MVTRRFHRTWIAAALSCVILVGMSGYGEASIAKVSTHRGAAAALPLVHSGYLTVGSDTTYPPMESKDPSTLKFVGADVDLANALAKAMKLKGAIIVTNTFDTLINVMLSRHKFDIIMSSMNDRPDRRKLGVNFIDYMRASEAIMVKKSSMIHANGYAGVCGHSVSVELGTTEADGLTAANKQCKNRITIKTFATDTEAYTAFASGHSDAYTSDYPVVANYVKLHQSQYREAGAPFGATENYGIAVPKKSTALYHALTAAYHQLRSNGQYRQILRRWGLQGAAI